jgi:pimeloyl-ACP methyl ester carboxylesterase
MPIVPDLKVNGTTLAYTDTGHGPPAVFVHGGSADLRSWEDQVAVFGSSYRAIALSCRGYYPNPALQPGQLLSVNGFVNDLVSFLRTLGLPAVHLVGHSSPGGLASLLLARSQPALLRSLVLIEPPAFPLLGVSLPPKPPQLLRLFFRDPIVAIAFVRFGFAGIGPAARAFRRGDDAAGLRSFMRANLGKEAFDHVSSARFERALQNVAPLKAQLRSGFPPITENEIRGIRVPTLLVSGGKSNRVLRGVTQRLQQLLPDVERLEIAGASHNMIETHPGEFNQGVLRFVGKHSGEMR